MHENKLASIIVNATVELHKNTGPGLLESVYENALAYDLKQYGLHIRQQVPLPFIYKNVRMDVGYRIDILVNQKVIIEIKAIDQLAPVHFAQTLTYLKLSNLKLGLLLNFNAAIMKGNIHRLVNNL